MSNSHQFNKSILREYDIRGIVGDTLNATDALYLGKGFGSRLVQEFGTNPTICVGYDGRLSSPELCNALIQGLTSTGVNVINIGLCPTPQLYFSVYQHNSDGGIMVTGSHNPSQYNG